MTENLYNAPLIERIEYVRGICVLVADQETVNLLAGIQEDVEQLQSDLGSQINLNNNRAIKFNQIEYESAQLREALEKIAYTPEFKELYQAEAFATQVLEEVSK